jgi:hypothetical protein
MISQATDGSWSFTLGAQTYTGYPTCESAQEAAYDLERGELSILTTKPSAVPAVYVERHVCDDAVDDENFGKEIGTEFHCREGDEEVELYIADLVQIKRGRTIR